MALTLEPGRTTVPGQSGSPNEPSVPASGQNAATAATPASGDIPGTPAAPASIADHELAAFRRQAIGNVSCVQNDWLAYLASLAR